jgi:hypothetical protein
MFSGITTMFSAVEKIASKPENIFWTSQNMVGGVQNMVEIGRRRMLIFSNDLMIVTEHGRRRSDHVL